MFVVRLVCTNLSICSSKGVRDPLFMVMEQSKLFGTKPCAFCVLFIDPTFSLGDFSVTCITYRNLLVTDTRTGQSPIMLGPLFVHQYSTYHFFASSLLEIVPRLVRVLAFGTNGEEALVKAFKQQLQLAVHLRCFCHMRQDIQRKMTTDMGFPNDIISELLADIFGNKDGPTFYEGLVDCNSEDEFDSKLIMLQE